MLQIAKITPSASIVYHFWYFSMLSADYDVLVIAFQGRKPFKSFVTGGPKLLQGLFSSHHDDGDDHDDDDDDHDDDDDDDGDDDDDDDSDDDDDDDDEG